MVHAIIVIALNALVACSPGGGTPPTRCNTGADCPSGAVCIDNVCVGADAGTGTGDSGLPPAADGDGDGISDTVEGREEPGGAVDTDGDGMPDYLDGDSDADGLSDLDEGVFDSDGDGTPNWRDPRNDGPVPTITLTAISTMFNSPIGIDYHEPTNSVVVSVNYPTGAPTGFERIELDGSHQMFSMLSGLTEEVKIGTVRSGNPAGFVTGDLFVGNGIDGQVARLTDGGAMVINPWLDLPGDNNGLMRGSIYVDRSGVLAGDLVLVTTTGEVWRVTAGGTPMRLAAVGVHLEGVVVVPDAPARFGPLAGRIIAGAEGTSQLFAIAPDGTVEMHTLTVAIEDIDIVPPRENFFGVNFGTSRILGAPAAELATIVGDIVLTQETHSGTGLYLLRWDGAMLRTEEIPVAATSAPVGQWEHVTFAPAGIVEISPII